MPAYTYACAAGHTTEHLLPIAQRDDARPCAQCGAPTSRRMEWHVATRIGKRGVMHIPGHRPARLSPEEATAHQRKDNPWQN